MGRPRRGASDRAGGSSRARRVGSCPGGLLDSTALPLGSRHPGGSTRWRSGSSPRFRSWPPPGGWRPDRRGQPCRLAGVSDSRAHRARRTNGRRQRPRRDRPVARPAAARTNRRRCRRRRARAPRAGLRRGTLRRENGVERPSRRHPRHADRSEPRCRRGDPGRVSTARGALELDVRAVIWASRFPRQLCRRTGRAHR